MAGVPMILFILVLFFSAGCGRKGALIAPEDVHSKERPQPQSNEPSAPGPQQGSQEESND
jgi:predicted small lipoprotein YifL